MSLNLINFDRLIVKTLIPLNKRKTQKLTDNSTKNSLTMLKL